MLMLLARLNCQCAVHYALINTGEMSFKNSMIIINCRVNFIIIVMGCKKVKKQKSTENFHEILCSNTVNKGNTFKTVVNKFF